MIPFNFAHALKNNIVGQKRTSAYKQFVFIDKEYVIKGPFKQNRYDNIISRYQIFTNWNTPNIMPIIDHFIIPEGIFIKMPNIMKDFELKSEIFNEKNTNYSYNVLVNPPIIDLRMALDTHPWIYDRAEELIISWCHMYILSVGDVNMRNTLINPNTQQFYMIDYDENISKEKDDNLFYFNSNPAKKCMWYEKTSYLYNNIANKIELLMNDPVIINNRLQNRVEKTVKLLRQHHKNKPEIIINNNLGKMIWKGIRGGHTKTFSGVDFDVAKSALQKYIRRSELNKALLCATELYRLCELGDEAQPAISNTFNRIAIIANEDIGPANLPLVLCITNIINNNEKDYHTLLSMVKLLCESNKTRLMSHAWRTFATLDGRKIAEKSNIKLDTTFTLDDKKYIKNNKNLDIFDKNDPEELKNIVLIFLKKLQEHDYNAYSWAYFFLNKTQDVSITKRKKFMDPNKKSTTGKVEILLWKAMSKILPQETHDILLCAYFKHTEKRAILQHAILICIHNLPYIQYNIDTTINQIKNNQKIKKLMTGEFELVIDDYVIDMHTRAGRKIGKNINDFVNEGTLVIPQDQIYYVAEYEKVYNTR